MPIARFASLRFATGPSHTTAIHDDVAYRVHECVFGVLAMESEPVDPRL